MRIDTCSQQLADSLQRCLRSVEDGKTARISAVAQPLARFCVLASLVLGKHQPTLPNPLKAVGASIAQACLVRARLEALVCFPAFARIEDASEALELVCNQLSSSIDADEAVVQLCADLISTLSRGNQIKSSDQESLQKLMNISYLLIQTMRYQDTGSPSIAQTNLQLAGGTISILYLHSRGGQDHLLTHLFEWSQIVRLFLDDLSVCCLTCLFSSTHRYGQDFPTRYAAILSLKHFHMGLCKLSSETTRTGLENRILLSICSAAYDSLTDDDEDIRDLASDVVSASVLASTLDAGFVPLTPTAAQQSLLRFLSESLGGPDLLMEGFARVLGMPSTDRIILAGMQNMTQRSKAFEAHIKPAEHLIEAAMKQDTALFVEEKQNLYKDEVSEAQLWADVLCKIPAEAVDTALVVKLRGWALSGLAKLEKLLEEHEGGAFSWTYKPDVFEIGARIFCVAKIVLAWERRSPEVPENGKIAASLSHVLRIGISKMAHPVSAMQIQDVLASLEDVVRQIDSNLD